MPRPGPPRPALAVAVAWAAALAMNRSLRDVEGDSMAPSLEAGDRLVVRPVGPWGARRGDVVLVRDPRRPERVTVKRLVGLPGEDVELREGRLRIDGVARLEPYVTGRSGDDRCHVPSGHVYVLGDNRRGSTDSRTYGPVPQDLVTAVVFASVRPLRWVRQPPIPPGPGDAGQSAGTRRATTSSSGSSSATSVSP